MRNNAATTPRPTRRIAPISRAARRNTPPLREVYGRLYATYGPQWWWLADSSFEVCLGAILTQGAAWSNVEKGLENLRRAGLFSPGALRAAPRDTLAALLYPCGYFNAKARKVKAFVEHLGERWSDDLDAFLHQPADVLRSELLGIYGIGPETADDIALHAAGQPSFVVDAYTRRLLARLGLADERWPYDRTRALFMERLPHDPTLFNEYHALIVRHGKERCLKRAPRCEGCCLQPLCPAGQASIGKRGAP
ncbi:MAG: hypothetical protein EXR48_02990 [Dehalococcoidia bacterium]|nr:hypothetical protein [Dehalococcoidia bacterium]